ncbi:unnamed protein product [Ostreobium quekettii]|uniref:Amidase domain-containing protein n=1 Tax=Ostreobium quekettii TaxID=121088 RepID=A0A8S1IV88_9CHLO|nr:unnamed protein product [Ostreobium quekettii]
MLIGKANMHELGMGITGINTYTGTPISPWRAGHCCGGSSSGSAAAVAYGLCPIAVGVDGGGSTRIPASLCGLVGLLPTTQRVGKQGHPTSFTIARIGPIATYVEDALILHTLISEAGSAGGIPPLISLPESLYTGESSDRPLAGLKMGIYWQWFTDADDDVVEACRQAVTRLESLGVVRVAINIPDLELMRVAHACTIASEQCESTNTPYVSKKWRRQMNNDVRMGLAMARTFTSRDYIHAQRVRRRMNTHFKKAMANIDMIVTPTVPVTAPRIHPTALKSNVIDSEQVFTVMRFMLGPNFLGLPAISVPVGRDSDGLPIGLQLIGKHWCEPLLFKVASALERQTREYTAVPGSAINPLTAD